MRCALRYITIRQNKSKYMTNNIFFCSNNFRIFHNDLPLPTPPPFYDQGTIKNKKAEDPMVPRSGAKDNGGPEMDSSSQSKDVLALLKVLMGTSYPRPMTFRQSNGWMKSLFELGLGSPQYRQLFLTFSSSSRPPKQQQRVVQHTRGLQ